VAKTVQNCSILLTEFHFSSLKRKQTNKQEKNKDILVYIPDLTLFALALRKIRLHKNCTIYNFSNSFEMTPTKVENHLECSKNNLLWKTDIQEISSI